MFSNAATFHNAIELYWYADRPVLPIRHYRHWA
jgi:hypothetical protein